MDSLNSERSGIVLAPLSSAGQDLVAQINGIIDDVFGDPISPAVLALESEAYFDLVLAAQTRVNALDIVKTLFQSDGPALRKAIGGGKPSGQRIAYLRAVRPSYRRVSEYVDFHRESFFNPDMAHARNVWIPIRDVTEDNTICFVPESQNIADGDIETARNDMDSATVKRFSSGHKIGLLYAPVRIVSGVDFTDIRPMLVPQGQMAIFDGNLVHGAGANHTDKIRFSLDFRIIDTEKIQQRTFNVAASGEYFTEID